MSAVSEALFPAVANLSDESGDEVPAQKPGAKRRKPKRQKKLPVDDGFRIRSMLGNPKCHCKHKCLQQFTGTASFQELEQFRKDWAGLHKLDQDTVEPRCRFLLNIFEVLVGGQFVFFCYLPLFAF